MGLARRLAYDRNSSINQKVACSPGFYSAAATTCARFAWRSRATTTRRIVLLPPYDFTPFALSTSVILSDMSAPSDARAAISCFPSGDHATAHTVPYSLSAYPLQYPAL